MQCSCSIFFQVYESVSGQTINKEKSAVLFSSNTAQDDRTEVKAALQIGRETMNDRYLGLPVHVGLSRVGTFKYLKERVWQLAYSRMEREDAI